MVLSSQLSFYVPWTRTGEGKLWSEEASYISAARTGIRSLTHDFPAMLPLGILLKKG